MPMLTPPSRPRGGDAQIYGGKDHEDEYACDDRHDNDDDDRHDNDDEVAEDDHGDVDDDDIDNYDNDDVRDYYSFVAA